MALSQTANNLFALEAYTSNALSITVGTNSVQSNIPELFEYDDISGICDGWTKVFSLSFNQQSVTVTDPFKLLITVNGIIQSTFVYNRQYVWLNGFTGSDYGFTINHDGNLMFSEPPPAGSQIMIRSVAGITKSSVRQYPFKPIDMMLA